MEADSVGLRLQERGCGNAVDLGVRVSRGREGMLGRMVGQEERVPAGTREVAKRRVWSWAGSEGSEERRAV
eukprot:3145413-Rhodomonas_salina.4